MRMAVVNGSTVINLIVAELDDLPPDNCILVPATEEADIGWSWDGVEFTAPPEVPPE